MSNFQDYEQKIDAIRAIEEKDVKEPNMPVSIFIQEGENLIAWCQADKDALIARGLNWTRAGELSACLGALREAQSRWNAERNTQEEAGKTWSEKAPDAYDLRDTLLHEFRYAYRNEATLMGRVTAIADGSGHADMIQDLNDLAVLGRENPAPFAAIKFNTELLDQAANTADEMGQLLALVNGDRKEHSEIKSLRDRAYTLCKGTIDEIRACGQYTFWRNADRLKGYASDYIRRQNKQRKPKEAQAGEL